MFKYSPIGDIQRRISSRFRDIAL